VATPLNTDEVSYYGSGESFVFSFTPSMAKFSWDEGSNDFFFVSTQSHIGMGGGGGGFAWELMEEELESGTSGECDTFRSPLLASSEFFSCLNVEVWTFEEIEETLYA